MSPPARPSASARLGLDHQAVAVGDLTSSDGWDSRTGDHRPGQVERVGGGHGEGRRFGIVSASLNRPRHLPVAYNNCLSLSVGPRGFRLSTFFLVRFQHPPLFVPWAFVGSMHEERRWLITMTTVEVRGVSTRLRFSGKPAAALREEFARYQQQMGGPGWKQNGNRPPI